MEEQIDVKYLPLWKRYGDMFDDSELTDAQVGRLIRIMIAYQFKGQEPEKVPKALRAVWTFLRKDLDDARVHYQTRVENGRKGGRKKKQPDTGATERNREEPKETEANREEVMTTTTSTSTSTTTSTSIEIGSAPSCPDREDGICLSKKCFGEFGWIRLTDQQYQDLERMMGPVELGRCITYIDQSAQTNGNRNRWKDWYVVLRRCYENRWHDAARPKEQIPCGASGYLGEAELEAIQRVLRE